MALIAGVASGMGRAAARALADHGADLLLADSNPDGRACGFCPISTSVSPRNTTSTAMPERWNPSVLPMGKPGNCCFLLAFPGNVFGIFDAWRVAEEGASFGGGTGITQSAAESRNPHANRTTPRNTPPTSHFRARAGALTRLRSYETRRPSGNGTTSASSSPWPLCVSSGS